jgi:hypothetical protein
MIRVSVKVERIRDLADADRQARTRVDSLLGTDQVATLVDADFQSFFTAAMDARGYRDQVIDGTLTYEVKEWPTDWVGPR